MFDLTDKFPASVEKAVEVLVRDMSFADRTRIANMNSTGLIKFHNSYGVFIRNEFRIPGNDPLMASCQKFAGTPSIDPAQASFVILKALHRHLKSSRVLRVVNHDDLGDQD